MVVNIAQWEMQICSFPIEEKINAAGWRVLFILNNKYYAV
jgi:hypothetical protein